MLVVAVSAVVEGAVSDTSNLCGFFPVGRQTETFSRRIVQGNFVFTRVTRTIYCTRLHIVNLLMNPLYKRVSRRVIGINIARAYTYGT